MILREKRLDQMKAISRLESMYCPLWDSVERRSLFRAEKGWACFRMRSVNSSISWKFIWKQLSNFTEYTIVKIPESIRLLETCFPTRIFRISWYRNFLKVAHFLRCSLRFWSLLHQTILNLFSLLMYPIFLLIYLEYHLHSLLTKTLYVLLGYLTLKLKKSKIISKVLTCSIKISKDKDNWRKTLESKEFMMRMITTILIKILNLMKIRTWSLS